MKFLQANCGDPDHTPLTAASALGLHCLSTSKNWTQGLYLLGKKLTFLQTDCEDPDKTPLTAASALSVHCLPTSKHLTLGPASVAQLDARPTEGQEVAGSTPRRVGDIVSWRLLMKHFLRSFSPFR